MSQKNILIIVVVIAVVAVGAFFVFFSPKLSIPSGEETEETEVPGDASVGQIPPEEGETEQQVQEFQEIEYKIINKGQITETAEGTVSGKKMVYDVLTGKINEERAKALAEKIIGDFTSEDSEIDSIILNFYSEENLIEEMKIDVAIVNWTPSGISVTMVEN